MHYIVTTKNGEFTVEAHRLPTLIEYTVGILKEKLNDDILREIFDVQNLCKRLHTEVKNKRGNQVQNVHIDIWPYKPDDSGHYLRIHFSCIDSRHYPWFASVKWEYANVTETNETLADRHRYFKNK